MIRRLRFIKPAHDPKFGIDPTNITDKLDKDNWSTCAVCRTDGHDHYYLYINQPLRSDDTLDPERFIIRVFNLFRPDYFGQQWRAQFSSLQEALDYANGEDQSDFAKQTWPDERPVKQKPKTMSEIAKAVHAAADELQADLNERRRERRRSLSKEEKKELFSKVATRASADHPIYREGATVTPVPQSRPSNTQHDEAARSIGLEKLPENYNELTSEEKKSLARKLGKVAGPDHPIYREGATVTPLSRSGSKTPSRYRNNGEGD